LRLKEGVDNMNKENQKFVNMAINLSKIAKLLKLDLITEEEYYKIREKIEKDYAIKTSNYVENKI